MSKDIDSSVYILLGTRKKDGSMVNTPVWFAGEQGSYFVLSAGNAGKVKRLRNFAQVHIAPCTITGKPLGDTLTANAVLLEHPADIRHAYQSLVKKYGWQMRFLDLGSWLSGQYNKRKFINITL
ncbi:MAG: PPOX class F420-dependent oxidoreductase [Pseudomonadales bacterium]